MTIQRIYVSAGLQRNPGKPGVYTPRILQLSWDVSGAAPRLVEAVRIEAVPEGADIAFGVAVKTYEALLEREEPFKDAPWYGIDPPPN